MAQPTQILRSTGSTAPSSLLAGQMAYCEGSGALYIGTIGGGVVRVNGNPKQPVTALSIASGVVDIDLALGDYFTLSLTANVTSITFSNLPASGYARTIAVVITQDGTGDRTVALPASFHATGGSDTVVAGSANATTILTATSVDQGTSWDYAMQERGA